LSIILKIIFQCNPNLFFKTLKALLVHPTIKQKRNST